MPSLTTRTGSSGPPGRVSDADWRTRIKSAIALFFMESAFHREPSTTGSDSALLTVDIDDRYNPTQGQAFDLLQGTLDLLILRTLELQPLHGVAIADRIEQVTRGVFV